MDWRIRASGLLLILASPLIISETLASTAHYRDVFFYADSAIAAEIVRTGHVSLPNGETGNLWVKLRARGRQPILPIFMAIGREVTGLNLAVFRGHLPIYAAVMGLFYGICRRFTTADVASAIAIAGGVIPPMGPMTAPGGRAIKYAVLLLLLWILLRYIQHESANRLLSAIAVPILLIHLLFNYPRLFVLGALCTGAVAAIIYVVEGRKMLVGPLMAGVGAWTILKVPFTAYASVIPSYFSVVPKILSNPQVLVSGSGTPATVLPLTSYSMYTTPVVIFGVIGGFIAVKRGVRQARNQGRVGGDGVLIGWGVGTAIFGALHLATGQIWLITRVYGISLILVLVASAIALDEFDVSSQHKQVTACLILVLMIVTYGLVAGSAWVDIHTYSSSDRLAAEWSSDFSDGLSSDMAHAALTIPHGDFSSYTRDEQSIKKRFYSQNSEVSELFLVTSEMATVGFYIPPYPRKPVSEEWYRSVQEQNYKVYTNGNAVLVR